MLLGDLSFTDGNELLFILTSASNLRLLHTTQLGFLTFGEERSRGMSQTIFSSLPTGLTSGSNHFVETNSMSMVYEKPDSLSYLFFPQRLFKLV